MSLTFRFRSMAALAVIDRGRRVATSTMLAALLATTAAAQPCHPITPDVRAAIARVERSLDEVSEPRPVRVSDVLTERRLVDVGGLPVHIFGRSADRRGAALRASVRRLAPALTAAISQLGPRVSQLPVYLLPLDESYDVGEATTLAETRCYDQAEPLYGTAAEPIVPGRSCVVVVFDRAMADDSELDFALAHEWFHTLQNASFPDADHSCRSAWWREGAADWFAHLVVRTDARANQIETFLRNVGRTSLTSASYEAQVFHFWAGERFGKPWVFDLGRHSDAELSSPAAVSGFMPADAWRDWAEALVDKRVTYPDGRPLPGFPLPSTLHAIDGSGTVPLTGPPLTVQYATATFGSAGSYEVAYESAGGLVSTAPVSALPIARAWTRIEAGGTRQAQDLTCAEPSRDFVAIRLGDAPLAAAVTYASRGTGGSCDACYLGSWREVVERQPDDVVIATGRQPITMTHAMPRENVLRTKLPDGSVMQRVWKDWPELTIDRDGTWVLDDPRTSTTIAADGTPLVVSDDTTYREHGTWQPGDGYVVWRALRREIRGTQTVMGNGSPYSEDRRLRGSQSRYVPLCSPDRLELWLPPILELRALQQRAPEKVTTEPARPARVFRRR